MVFMCGLASMSFIWLLVLKPDSWCVSDLGCVLRVAVVLVVGCALELVLLIFVFDAT